MGDKHVIDLQQMLEIKCGDAATGIDQNIVINQKAGGVAPAADTAAAA